MTPLSSWVLTDGKAGMENQCLGLAEALELAPIVKRVRLRKPWRYVTPYVRFGGPLQFARDSDPLAPPWPDLLFATGRHSVAASLLVKKKSGGRTRTVQLQNPAIDPRHFDLVIVPEHDRLSGENVISTRGALHRVTPKLLRDGAEHLAPRLVHLPRPYIGVLIGGSNAAYRLGPLELSALAGRLAACARAMGASLILTPSRRTGEDNLRVLRTMLAGVPHYLWDMHGDNPYFGILGLADFIVVTCDSVNMVSEAASTGKPVYVADLPGGSVKVERFRNSLADAGIRPFAGTLAPYSYRSLDDMQTIAERVKTRLRLC